MEQTLAITKTAETEVTDIFQKYVEAWRKGDIDALGEIYSLDDDLTAIWPDPCFEYPLKGWVLIRSALTDVFRRCRGMNLEYSNQIVHASGESVVIVAQWKWAGLAAPPNPGAAATAGKLARTSLARGCGSFVFHRRGSRWVLVHEHSAGLPGALAAN